MQETPQPSEPNPVAVENAFKSWLVAVADAAGRETGRAPWPGLAQLIGSGEVSRLAADARLSGPQRAKVQKELNGLRAATAGWAGKSNGENLLKNWHRRGMPGGPDPFVLRALVRVVERLSVPAPHDVGPWTDFKEVVNQGQAMKKAVATHRVEQLQQESAEERAKTLGGLLVIPPCAAADLPLERLGLGSWAFDGIPPYTPRTADTRLQAALTAADTRFTVVVGHPKSGKTRSLVEVLEATAPDATVWWVNTGPKVLPKIAEALERETKGDGGNTRSAATGTGGVVVVLDDLHRCGTNPADGLTDAVLSRLTQHAAAVIATLHAGQLAAWALDAIDHTIPGADLARLAGIGATRELIAQLSAGRIDYHSDLDPDEYAAAVTMLAQSPHSERGPDGTLVVPANAHRLAEYLAAVDQLVVKAEAGRESGGYRRALLNAVIDATQLYPGGATPAELEQLTGWAYEAIAPTRLWDGTDFNAALDWATEPIGGPGSPHALITPNPARTGYQLFDALVSRLRPADHTLDHLLPRITDLSGSARLAAGQAAVDRKDHSSAETWWRSAVRAGRPDAMSKLGWLAERAGDLPQAQSWWEQAAEAGHPDAMFNLGVLAEKAGDLPQARSCYERADEAGHAGAMYRLGILAERAGDLPQAQSWWERAAEAGGAEAMFWLGIQAEKAGDLPQVRSCYERAAEAGHVGAWVTLGWLAERAGDLPQARSCYERVAEAAGDPGPWVLEARRRLDKMDGEE